MKKLNFSKDLNKWLSFQTIGLFLLTLQVLLSGVILFRIIKLQDSLSLQNTTAEVTKGKKYENILTGDYPPLGNKNAKVTIIEFLDYQCPYCLEATNITSSFLEKYPDDIQIYYRDFPLESIHPEALASAIAARCAGQQNQFWPFNKALFLNQDKLNKDMRTSTAQELSLDMDLFNSCISSSETETEIQKSIAEGKALGIQGTPTFFINGYMVTGIDIEKMYSIIESEISK